MDENDYIENYFAGALSLDDMKLFDEKIQNDPAFAEKVTFYYSAMTAIKSEVAEEKKKRFRELYKQQNTETRTMPLRRLWPYVAAAAVITAIVLGFYLFGAKSSPSQLADKYIKDRLIEMDVRMGAADSLQKGGDLYNHKDYAGALKLFTDVLKADSANAEAKKRAGIVSLQLQQYDKALEYFIALEQTSLQFNPGKFYHALTLMKRNQPRDFDAAKKLLQEVVDKDFVEKKTAAEWLKKL